MSEELNAATYLVHRQIEQGHAGRVAVTGSGGTLTYAELGRRVTTADAGWRAAGLRPGDRVVIHAADGLDTLVALLSVIRAGAIAVPVSVLYSETELVSLLRDSRARFLFAGGEQVGAARAASAEAPMDLRAVVAPEGAADELSGFVARLSWERDVLGSGADILAPHRTTEDSPALWLYTSGTTGMPKAAMHRHGSIRFVAEAYGREVLGIGTGDRCFSAAKLSFAYGLGNSCFFPLSAGATTVLEPARPTPAVVARGLVTHRPSVFFAVPSSYAALVRADEVPDDAFSSVRLAVTAGEPLPSELERRVRERFGVDLVNGLGTTETLHIFLSTRPGRPRPGSVGTAVPGYEVRVVAADGSDAAPGTPGTLRVMAPSAATGYWARPDAERAVFDGEWVNTGDIVVRDKDGHHTCLGRTSDVIKSGGLWVSPAEVEARLLAHPAVAEAAVVALPDADGLDKPVACVVPADGARLDPAELIAFCRDGLASFKCPRQVLTFDTLPTNTTGKLARRALREQASTRMTVPEVPVMPTTAPGPLDLMFHQASLTPSTVDTSANVGALLRLRGTAPTLTDLRSHVAKRVGGVACLSHFLAETGGEIRWQHASPGLLEHVIEEALPEGPWHLDAAVDRLRRTPLATGAPPWRLWLLRGHCRDQYALFYLTQHDVQDAANIAAVLEALFGPEIPPESSSGVVSALADAPPPSTSDFLGTLEELVRCTRGHGLWHRPEHPLSGRRAVHWTEVPTDLLRTTGRALGGSANDVHLAALGHAMATWAGEHWPALSRADVPIMVPLNLRHPGQVGLAGNQFFLSRITVPGGQAAPLRRLAGTITATTPLKSIPHRVALGRALELLPRPLLDLVTGVCTTPDQLSVVGSCFALRHPLRFRDDPVERVAPLICCPDGFPATVALFLYQDVSTACFHLDEALPAAETIPDHWRAAVNEMAAAVSVRAEPVA